DVRVRESGREARLAEEAPPQILVPGEVLGEPLQRHRTVELGVVSEVHGRHRSVAERADELVAARHAGHGAHWSFPPPSPPPPRCPWSSWWSCFPGGLGFGFWGTVTMVVTVQVRPSASLSTPMTSGERRRGGSLCSAARTWSRRESARCIARQLSPAEAAAAICDAWPSQACARRCGTPCRPGCCGREAPPQLAAAPTTSAASGTILNAGTHVPGVATPPVPVL